MGDGVKAQSVSRDQIWETRAFTLTISEPSISLSLERLSLIRSG